jgi:capsular exopolysaccharide synthesis family protein
LLAALLGLLVGVGAAFLRNSLDRRWTDSHEIQRELGLPLVGSVREDILGHTVSANGDRGLTEEDLEAFRILRTNVEFMVKDRKLGMLAVTSALPEEGKSTVAAGFAYASALAGRRTVLVECDFRRPVMATRTGVERAPGLSEYLGGNGTIKPAEILRPLPVRGGVASLPVIPAGESSFHPAEMIASDRFRDFLDQIGRAYDLVVLDTAPLLPVGDTLELLPLVDSTLLCVRLGQTTREQGQAAKVAMEHLPEKPTGLVVTGIRPGSEGDYYGYYSYQSPIPEKTGSPS